MQQDTANRYYFQYWVTSLHIFKHYIIGVGRVRAVAARRAAGEGDDEGATDANDGVRTRVERGRERG
jgi:hypothetical protein